MGSFRSSSRFAFALALSAAGICAASAVAYAAAPSVSLDTGLTPSFDTSVLDYVTTCAAGKTSVTAVAPAGTTIKVDSAVAKSGSQTVSVPLKSSGQRFQFTVAASGKSTSYSVRCLPPTFPKFTASGALPASSPFMAWAQTRPIPKGFAIVSDARGTPIWWRNTGIVSDIKPVGVGRIGFWTGIALDGANGEGGAGHFIVVNLNGTKVAEATTGADTQDAHETILTPRGTWYVARWSRRNNVDVSAFGGAKSVTVFDVLLRELSSTGKVLWSWKSQDHIALAETGKWFDYLNHGELFLGGFPGPASVYDLVHLNSIEEDQSGGLIISTRHPSAVYRIIKSTGAIDWKLGGTTTAKSLAVVGDQSNSAIGHLGGQHDARLLADGTISILDNGTGAFDPGLGRWRAPRATRWSIDRVKRTATLVESLSDVETAPGSACCGSARKLADGSWLVAWGGSSTIAAYNPSQTKVFALTISGGYTYRAAPITTAQMTRAQLLAGMDAMHPR